jgi:hypothetical protein
MHNLNTSAICTETSENVTERPILGQHGSIARVTVAHFWPSIFKTNVWNGVYGLVFRSPCATPNTRAICTQTSENVTERPFLGQHSSIARATVAPFWLSTYKTHVCYGVYELVFRSPCATSNTSAFCTETSENVMNDRFSVSTAPLQEQQRRIFDRLYIRQMFAMGCTG